ncbi:AAA family ATPase [Clostridium botulinum]|uniref:AAA family ATPase n=1 Tax=Clostridium botulinum TaxID=1491 RepID=UPI000774CE01|nr:AAA family ATPase [Clostridium botulinum]AUM92703.1 acyl-CoA dehydrogenase [Clostridium botulinum]NFB12066.1 acyl-CoA dehydrogenase [Clostridium botulinum]NFH59582.1 acyl-CoA dehydrogenase [Clostridium botulinum]NFJ87153.1 acyl-CoA dehydrogenase [Clostridium botulinum]NFV31345.1 acyl-CoA dehydrogenase [Clostridium botulinum]
MVNSIFLKNLSLKNFKGIKDLTIDFGKVTNIFGENGTGKTTIQDSFTFLLFDKDSKDSTKFDVQPLDENNNPIHNLETVIEATLDIDGKEVVLKRVYKEKYNKVRGTAKTEFKGYESKYYVNEVPKKVTEYKNFISGLLDEKLFKLITNPSYFPSLPWKDRRSIITEIVGDLDNKVVLDFKKDLEPLKMYLKDKSLNDFVKANRSKINQLKKDRMQIPSRIDEVNNSIQEFDFDGLDIQRRGVAAGIKNIDEQLLDKSKANEGLFKLKTALLEKRQELTETEYKFKANANKPKMEIEAKIRSAEINIRHLNMNINEFEKEVKRNQEYIDNTLVLKRNNLLEIYNNIKNSKFEFNEENCICPTCKRKFETNDIEAKREELEGNFNSNKAKKLKENIAEGKSTAAKIEELKSKNESLSKKIEDEENMLAATKKSLETLQGKLNSFKTEIEDPEKIKYIKQEIYSLESQIQSYKKEDTTELNNKKEELQEQLSKLDKQLTFKETNEKAKSRIQELEEEETKLSEKIAELEGLEILSEEFIRTKVELLEEKVNSKFKYVKFKMFKNQINGGLEETCEPCINGVPYSSNLNSAAKINAGLDIINTLCNHYNINAPIFIDNRESTNKIIDVDSQVINLIVSKDKKMKVEVI